jgi:FkbM family methyltransferase
VSAVKRAATRVTRALPASRRVKGLGGAKGRRWLQARKLVAPLLQRPVTLTTSTGLRLRVSADPVDEQIAQHLLGRGRRDYFPAWPPAAPPPTCILDVGGHHGLYAAAALHEYRDARIICVEPSAGAIRLLEQNLDANGYRDRARVVAAALAPERGTGTLRHTTDGSWGSSLHDDEHPVIGQEDVPLATLDDILQDDRPEVVKCNAEGAEFALIDALARSTLRPTVMVVMVHPQFGDMDALVAQAEAMGYTVASVGPDNRPVLHMWRVPGGSAGGTS